mmetsp:Transcript_31742/g.77885  ORF Transcript_31742/g.77885 Transcript_31742/m.77885 type:complete len:416 (+) Transcript_31742:136-1383(+)
MPAAVSPLFRLLFPIFVAGSFGFLWANSPIDPSAFELPPLEPLPDDARLQDAERLFKGLVKGPEDMVFSCEGADCFGYASLADGQLLRWTVDGGSETLVFLNRTACVAACPSDEIIPRCGELAFEDVCGRPLGLEMSPDGTSILIADAYFGLLSLQLSDNTLRQVAGEYRDLDGRLTKLNFPNAVVFGKSGKLYVDETTSRFQRRTVPYETLEGGNTGGLLVLDDWRDAEAVPRKVLAGLHFANGMLLDKDERFILVLETTRARLTRVDLSDASKVTATVAYEGLPCTPDNMAWAGEGQRYIWIGCAVRRTKPFSLLQATAPYPGVRRFLAAIAYFTGGMQLLYKLLPKTGMLLLMDLGEAGTGESPKIVDTLLDKTGGVMFVAGGYPFGDKVYIGSHKPEFDFIARIHYPAPKE